MTEAVAAPPRPALVADHPPDLRHRPQPRPRTRRAAVLFDLDGVLWDSSRVHAQAFQDVSSENGLTPVAYSDLAGLSTEAAWSLILRRNERHLSASEVNRLSAQKRLLARNALAERPPLSTGLELLAGLNAAGLPLGLVTGSSKETVDVFLRALGQPDRFAVVVTAASALPSKPAPDPYLHAARELGVRPQDCWVLEDSASGLASATTAGARVVHLTPLPCRQPHAWPVLRCVTDIRSFVRLAISEDAA